MQRPFERDRSPREILAAIEALPLGPVNLMEVCGTHTVAIARSGLRQMLPSHVKLLSGPGCPVCVTPAPDIDEILDLADRPDVMVATYGDMLRVPGTRHGDSLRRRSGRGAGVKMVYSALDAVDLAEKHPDREVVFLGVGFETTAPGTAVAVEEARRRGLENFSLVSLLKTVQPALRALIADPDFAVQGFLCPGHVAVITGAEEFAFLPEEFGLPAVVSGFEPMDLLLSVYHLLRQLAEGAPALENEYDRAVPQRGNPLALAAVERCFEPCDAVWRGLGMIPRSGLALREAYADFDAVRRFGLRLGRPEPETACRCGEVITGKRAAEACPLFGTVCVPENPVGPCMVSGEGACAAAYQYRSV
jgi:hydrogenase expression/formation protein HypD